MLVSELGQPRPWVLNWVSHAPESVHERIVRSCDGISANNILEFIHHVEEGRGQQHQRQSGTHRHSGTAAVNGKRCSWQLSPQHIVSWHWRPSMSADNVGRIFVGRPCRLTVLACVSRQPTSTKFSAKKHCKNVWWLTLLACESLERQCWPINFI